MSALGLMWSNLHRRPVRTYLTLLSVLVAFLLFTTLRTLAAWFEGGAAEDISGVDRLVVTAKYSIIDLLPISFQGQILGVEGVEAVAHQTWFGGNYQDPRNFFPKFPVAPKSYFDMYPEMKIDPDALEAFQNTRTGAVVSAGMMERYGWQIGDKIPIEADIYPMRDGSRLWQFDLVGSYAWEEDNGQPLMLFHYDFFDEARQFGEGSVGWYTVRIGDPDRAPEVAKNIDALFENSMNPTKTATEDEFNRAFFAQVGDIGLMTTGILSAVFFTIVLLTAVTMNQALRERIPELAVLKTLGFSDAKVALVVLGESVLLCVIGGLAGIGLTVLLEIPLNALMSQSGFGVFELSGQVVAVAAVISVVLGLVVGASPAWSAKRLTIAEALRRR